MVPLRPRRRKGRWIHHQRLANRTLLTTFALSASAVAILASVLLCHSASVSCSLHTPAMTLGRRQSLVSVGSLAGFMVGQPPMFGVPAAIAIDTADARLVAARDALLRLIPDMPYGAPATNITLPSALVRQIESAAVLVEQLASPTIVNVATDPALNAAWRLLYSNSAEIVNLAKLPLGFELGPVYQPLDISGGAFENQARVDHSLGVASLSTRVVGEARQGAMDGVNLAGVRNVAGNRLDVDFRRVVFSFDRIFAISFDGLVRKVVSPQPVAGAPQTSVDITYLDPDVRVTRGGDGALFVLRREVSSMPMLVGEAREALLREGGAAVVTGAGLGNWSRAAGPGVIAGSGN